VRKIEEFLLMWARLRDEGDEIEIGVVILHLSEKAHVLFGEFPRVENNRTVWRCVIVIRTLMEIRTLDGEKTCCGHRTPKPVSPSCIFCDEDHTFLMG
jgi:hypothetical protein